MYGNWVFLGNLASPLVYLRPNTDHVSSTVHSKLERGATPYKFLPSEMSQLQDNMVLIVQALSGLYPKQDIKDDFTEMVTQGL